MTTLSSFRRMCTVELSRALVLTISSASIITASAQCGTIWAVPPVPMHHAMVQQHRSDGPAQFIIPVLVHVYYTDLFPSVSAQQVVDMIALANLDLRGNNSDTADVASPFRDLVSDLSVELRLAHLDTNGNCTSGIDYHWWDGAGFLPDVSGSTQNTARYLNIYVHQDYNSHSYIPSPGSPLPGDPWDGITMTTWDVLISPRVLAHEVGHWVGLYHTFGDTNDSGVDCGDDGVADTPITKGSVPGTCDTTLSQCTPGTIENVDNMMDYSNCEKMFTTGQAERVAAVMTDTTIARYMHCTPENLLLTGVDIPSTCPLSSDFHITTFLHCDSSEVRFHPLSTGQIPDQLAWSFPGGSPAMSTEDEPHITYTSGGTYSAQLIACFGTDCDTVAHDFTVEPITGLQNNGLSVASTPWSEDFENGFDFPQTNMAVLTDTTPNWQPCDFAGYNSGHSLYIPTETLGFLANDTNDLIIGNFDFTGLWDPAITFKVAATYYTGVQYYYFYLMMGDLCDQSMPVQTWIQYLQPDLSGPNTYTGFLPNTPEQWTTITFANPSWHYYPHAEIVLRVIKPWMGPVNDEGIYVDDINIGEADVVLGPSDSPDPHDPIIFPSPATDHVRINSGAHAGPSLLVITDMGGREVYREWINGQADLDVSAWPRGCYLTQLSGKSTTLHVRLILR
jgi:hypothetical protein